MDEIIEGAVRPAVSDQGICHSTYRGQRIRSSGRSQQPAVCGLARLEQQINKNLMMGIGQVVTVKDPRKGTEKPEHCCGKQCLGGFFHGILPNV